MSKKIIAATVDPDHYGITLTVTGAGGFGKTSLVIDLCYYSEIKNSFTDGVVFVELGPQATDPSIKLSQLYHLLTGKYLQHGDINHAEQEIKKLTVEYNSNFLVIIDDVWHVEDAEPILKAFCNCKTVLTTRKNDIVKYVPTNESVIVDAMEQEEAISLLSFNIIDSTKLTQETKSLLNELSEDVHLWPLLLSLIRGQLSYHLKQQKVPIHNAIHAVQAKLRANGLTSFDKNNIANIESSRKYAVKACIEVTLRLLMKSTSDKLKALILFTGIGTSVPTDVLKHLWKISEQTAWDIVDDLWAYGLVQFIQKAIPSCTNIQLCVEVHAVISQYIIDIMDSVQVTTLTPFASSSIYQSVDKGLVQSFQQCYGVQDVTLLTATEYLKFLQSEIEHVQLPTSLKMITMRTVLDPHFIILLLQQVESSLINSPNTLNVLAEQISTLKTNCDTVLKDVHKLSRKLNQKTQRYLHAKDYESLIQVVDDYCVNYPVGPIALNCLTMVKSMQSSDFELRRRIKIWDEVLHRMTPSYLYITLMTLPRVKLYTKLHRQIVEALQTESSNAEQIIDYYTSGRYNEEVAQFWTNYLNKLQEVAPDSARQLISQHH